MKELSLKNSKPTTVRCHCGKTCVELKSEQNVDVRIVVFCSKACREDWATGGM